MIFSKSFKKSWLKSRRQFLRQRQGCRAEIGNLMNKKNYMERRIDHQSTRTTTSWRVVRILMQEIRVQLRLHQQSVQIETKVRNTIRTRSWKIYPTQWQGSTNNLLKMRVRLLSWMNQTWRDSSLLRVGKQSRDLRARKLYLSSRIKSWIGCTEQRKD